jgi:hypothetical protein
MADAECLLTDVLTQLDVAFASGRTPLILDSSPDDNVCTFFSYRDASLIEAKKIVMAGRGTSSVEVLEPFRQSLVSAMKYGRLLVIRLANSAPSLHEKWNDETLGHDNSGSGTAYFPSDIFYEGGKRLYGDNWPDRLYRASERPSHGILLCR